MQNGIKSRRNGPMVSKKTDNVNEVKKMAVECQ